MTFKLENRGIVEVPESVLGLSEEEVNTAIVLEGKQKERDQRLKVCTPFLEYM